MSKLNPSPCPNPSQEIDPRIQYAQYGDTVVYVIDYQVSARDQPPALDHPTGFPAEFKAQRGIALQAGSVLRDCRDDSLCRVRIHQLLADVIVDLL